MQDSLHDTRAGGLLQVFERLDGMARNYVEASSASTAEEHVRQAKLLIQRVCELGHLETKSKPEERVHTPQLRDARAIGFL